MSRAELVILKLIGIIIVYCNRMEKCYEIKTFYVLL